MAGGEGPAINVAVAAAPRVAVDPALIAQYQTMLNNHNLSAVQALIEAHPEIDITTVGKRQTGNTLYMELLFSDIVRADHSLFAIVLARRPDPFLQNRFGQTALSIVEDRYEQFGNEQFRQKLELARDYQTRWVRNQEKPKARNLKSLMMVSKVGLGNRGLNPNMNQLVKEFLTGETGTNGAMMSKLRVKAGLPGVSSNGTRRRRTRRRRSTRRRRG